MASKAQASAAAIFLSFNLLFFAIATATQYPAIPGTSSGTGNGGGGSGTGNGGGGGGGGGNSGGGAGQCPRDALKLGVCANLLGGLVGTPPTLPCCSLIAGLADLEAAVCLCTAIRVNLLGINLNVPLSLSLILNNCGRQVPNGFAC